MKVGLSILGLSCILLSAGILKLSDRVATLEQEARSNQRDKQLLFEAIKSTDKNSIQRDDFIINKYILKQ